MNLNTTPFDNIFFNEVIKPDDGGQIFLDFDEFRILHGISCKSLQSRLSPSSSSGRIKRLLHTTLKFRFVPTILRMKLEKTIKPFLKQYYHKIYFEILKSWINYLNSEMNRLQSVVCKIYNYYQEIKKRSFSHRDAFVEPVDYLVNQYYKAFVSSSWETVELLNFPMMKKFLHLYDKFHISWQATIAIGSRVEYTYQHDLAHVFSQYIIHSIQIHKTKYQTYQHARITQSFLRFLAQVYCEFHYPESILTEMENRLI